MSREIVRFVPNMPQHVALKYASGKPVDGQYGPQVMYTLDDDRVMYLDPVPAKMIETLGPKPGEAFTVVVKWTGRKGERREWDVYRHLIRQGEEMERQLEHSITQAEGRKAAARAEAPAQQPAAPARGTGTHGPVAMPAPAARPIPTKKQYADAFALFLVDAIHATAAAERAVQAEGLSIRFDAGQVQAIATTMFIQASKDGYVEWNGGAK